MHIPDGYLSPSTCASLYCAAAPFWYVALKRVKNVLNARAVPSVALFAAFSFVVMMFNLPLPGGTSGHAVGMGMASVVLGPWISILAISMALFIQALFFGDGGITAFGANCFNMAIMGSLVAYSTYRLFSLRAAATSFRRVIAAGFAGYAAINAAAFCAAVEFGIQPIFFHDANGAPLYAPYPLSISVPAMMIGHLTFAGLAEFVISAGVVSFLQRADIDLLATAAPAQQNVRNVSRPLRKLWLVLAIAVVLTPLGVIAVGTAWGEWNPSDLLNSAGHQKTATHSRPLSSVPAGLQQMFGLWSAPLPGYQPSFSGNISFGYFLSGLIGVLLIVAATLGVGWVASRTRGVRRRHAQTFIERTMTGLLAALEDAFFAEQISRSKGLLQRLDARVKLIGIGSLIVAAIAVHRLDTLAALFAMAVLLGLLSRVSLLTLIKRVWIPVLAFTGLVALPAVFLAPGRPVFRVPVIGWSIAAQGLTSAAFLLLRAETTATLSLLLVLCTPWNRLLRTLRFFRAPSVVVLMLEMAHRYVFLLLNVVRNMLESRKTRHVGRMEPSEQRRLAAATAGVLLDKTLRLSDDVYAAMLARGYRNEVYLLDDLRLAASDWV
ncbi:MAG TPA: cobalt transporter CbiM, partial [Bryobacteraceae bacterium]|nr:cobalt transporter CbiM [Bryobacteraceae bacterium]